MISYAGYQGDDFIFDFTHIDELHAHLKQLRPLNAGELNRLQAQFVIDNTYNSNAIEGNSLTLRETALILQEGITIAQKPLKEHLEAIGHRRIPVHDAAGRHR